MRLREATIDDMKLIFDWANEKECRKNSFSSDIITYESHQIWYGDLLEDENKFLYILENDNIPVAQVRMEKINNNQYRISYSVDALYRGRNYGRIVLTNLELKIRDSIVLVAEVKKDNIASMKLFESLNYQKTDKSDCYVFTKKVN